MYWFAVLATLLIWGATFIYGGFDVLFTVIVLTLLEITFSADNAVINSKVLVTMSPLWQRLFMTIGIIIAVFLVRFIAPLIIVAATAGLGLDKVLDLAIAHPHEYEQHLSSAEPLINAFGGTFLLMIALSYFIDYRKHTHWFARLERLLGKLGRFDNITPFIMLVISLGMYFTIPAPQNSIVLATSIFAMALQVGLSLLDAIFEERQKHALALQAKVGLAALVAFMYLEILDASFSLDGVIGAFALTSDVFVIMAGLGAGAVWVRAMTVHIVRAGALKKYKFLEQGAHWAIAFLGLVMFLKLYHIELPQWLVGSLGLVTIGLAILWSAPKHTRD
jgi:hypothetical protein